MMLFWRRPSFLLLLYSALAVGASLHAYLRGKKSETSPYTHYNNFLIFRQSYFHLRDGKDLYQEYPTEHWDYYKYSPTFALLMFPFAFLPDWLGLILWNLTNALLVWTAIYALPLGEGIQAKVLLFCAIELLTSIQNSQSNGLMAGLMVWAFALFERKRFIWGALMIALSFHIKLFSLILLSLLLFYPERWRAGFYTLFWIGSLALLPLIHIGPTELLSLYRSWIHLLSWDYEGSVGLSVAGWLRNWFGLTPPKPLITLVGLTLLLLPLVRKELYQMQEFRLLFLSSLLIWSVIFNHKAESPTYIIAVVGIALWYFLKERSLSDKLLAGFVFVFTSLSPTDIFPPIFRQKLVIPFALKAFPCIIGWVRIGWEMIRKQRTQVEGI
ncbi:MAG: glycosyltransferase family 87 protein [Bacteroidia bacterium]|nr:glycosyltransferase family 87 protein [Bacteroidia bacterium]